MVATHYYLVLADLQDSGDNRVYPCYDFLDVFTNIYIIMTTHRDTGLCYTVTIEFTPIMTIMIFWVYLQIYYYDYSQTSRELI